MLFLLIVLFWKLQLFVKNNYQDDPLSLLLNFWYKHSIAIIFLYIIIYL